MTFGYLYVLSNASMPGLIKIGKTTRDPTMRVSELSSATGVPHPFTLVYFQPVDDCDTSERWVHEELERRGHRPNAVREFFSAPVYEAVELINASQALLRLPLLPETRISDQPVADVDFRMEEADKLNDLAYTYFHGTDDLLADRPRAMKLYERSAALGSIDAAVSAGSIYHWGSKGMATNLRKALALHQQAVAGGRWRSLASVASIFELSEQYSSAETHWKRFFEAATEAVSRVEPELLPLHLRSIGFWGASYCWAVVEFGTIKPVVPPRTLRKFRDSIVENIEMEIGNKSIVELHDGYKRCLVFIRSQGLLETLD